MTERSPAQRLFLGVGLDDETRHAIAAVCAGRLPSPLPGRPVRPESWHITLRFLGWTTEPAQDRILAILDEALRQPPFTARLGPLGAFPNPARATVLWIGVDRGADELDSVAAVCEDAAQRVGFTPEDRPFHPHLTLSRIRPQQDVRSLVADFGDAGVRVRVTGVTLFHSRPGRGGAVYEAIDDVELRA